ncbi:MAG: ATP-binding protein [Bacteroidales bacterium]|nr:ATP-binding protein [Bacteroidales bacterium]
MEFKIIKNTIALNIILIIIGIAATILCLHNGFWLTMALPTICIILGLLNITKYYNSLKKDINKFLFALENNDYSVFFNSDKKSSNTAKLYSQFNNQIEQNRKHSKQAESQFLLFSTILENHNQGIIVVKESALENNCHSEITYINDAACRILSIPKHKYWSRIEKIIPQFTTIIAATTISDKKLIRSSINGVEKEISLDINITTINKEKTYIISFQDIRDEIEQKEIEAWHNLIRILTHEIMNSLTPINVLSEAATEMINNKDYSNEDLTTAMNTIKRRTDGLMSFVNDYRTLTDIPIAEKKNIKVDTLLKNVSMIMSPLIKKNNIKFEIINNYRNLVLNIDDALIEQVLINLITNSIHATQTIKNPEITIIVEWENDKYSIKVKDNGVGIETKNLNKIFVPFFSTRENGSGIGLSLSRNIMRTHQGTLRVTSEPGNTVFTATL